MIPDYFLALTKPADRCEALQQLSYLNLIVSIFLVVGILISYLPQHWRIISRGTPEGISAGFILLGETSSTSALANILLLPNSRADVACCSTVSTFECVAGLLGIAQVTVQWGCFTFLFFLFLIFTPRGSALLTRNDEDEPQLWSAEWWKSCLKSPWQKAIGVAVACILHGLVVIIITTALAISRPQLLGNWAHTLGLTATALAVVQYVPQLWETWRRGHVGSLSIPMMCIQTPGSFIFAASLAARLGIEGWSSWGMFLVTGCLQGALLTMSIIFEIRDRRRKRDVQTHIANGWNGRGFGGHADSQSITETDDEGNAVVENRVNERTPLLR